MIRAGLAALAAGLLVAGDGATRAFQPLRIAIAIGPGSTLAASATSTVINGLRLRYQGSHLRADHGAWLIDARRGARPAELAWAWFAAGAQGAPAEPGIPAGLVLVDTMAGTLPVRCRMLAERVEIQRVADTASAASFRFTVLAPQPFRCDVVAADGSVLPHWVQAERVQAEAEAGRGPDQELGAFTLRRIVLIGRPGRGATIRRYRRLDAVPSAPPPARMPEEGAWGEGLAMAAVGSAFEVALGADAMALSSLPLTDPATGRVLPDQEFQVAGDINDPRLPLRGTGVSGPAR